MKRSPQRRVGRKWPTPPPPGHSFRKPDDPPPLADELERLRHDEWKRTSVGDGRGAAEVAKVRMALLRGWEAANGPDRSDALRNAIIGIERQVHMNRMWGGMEWKYHAMPAFRVEAIAKLCREALEHV